MTNEWRYGNNFWYTGTIFTDIFSLSAAGWNGHPLIEESKVGRVRASASTTQWKNISISNKIQQSCKVSLSSSVCSCFLVFFFCEWIAWSWKFDAFWSKIEPKFTCLSFFHCSSSFIIRFFHQNVLLRSFLRLRVQYWPWLWLVWMWQFLVSYDVYWWWWCNCLLFHCFLLQLLLLLFYSNRGCGSTCGSSCGTTTCATTTCCPQQCATVSCGTSCNTGCCGTYTNSCCGTRSCCN